MVWNLPSVPYYHVRRRKKVSSAGGSRQFGGFTFGRPMPPAEVSFGGGAAFGRPSLDEYLKEGVGWNSYKGGLLIHINCN